VLRPGELFRSTTVHDFGLLGGAATAAAPPPIP
jgi:hypothetical protein